MAASSGSSSSSAASVVRAPIAQVAPGSSGYNALCAPGVAAMILGDFDRTGIVNHVDPEYMARITRPGAIVLPNLDIDELSRVAVPPVDLSAFLDCADNRVNTTADEADLSVIKLRKPDPCSIGAASVLIRVHPDDGRRLRLFQIGAGPDPVLGPGKTSSGPQNEFVVVTPVPPNPYAYDYWVEALTLPGDPSLTAPSGPTPNAPALYPRTLPSGSSGSPIYVSRGPGELWFEIVHRNSGGIDLTAPRDVAVVTIAPFMLLSNLQPLQQAYVVYVPDYNHDFVYEIAEALSAALGTVTVPSNTSTMLTTHRPAHDPSRTAAQTPGGLYIVEGSAYRDDVWIQDEMEIGYCFAPHGWMHVVMHCRRNRDLAGFVDSELASPGLGLYTGLSTRSGNLSSLDYGGNIEVSPPVAVATPALPADGGGPAVKAHRPAPFGKILVGDRRNPDHGPLHREVHDFFVAQGAQAVLPFDTSWLEVGHIDEVMSFVPSNRGRGQLLIMASIRAMTFLLEELVRIPYGPRRSHFHAGKYEYVRRPGSYDEQSAENLLATKSYNEIIRRRKLAPIQTRLRAGVALSSDEVVPFPTYFKLPADPNVALGAPDNRTVANTVGSVNMLVANRHLLIPRPFAARVAPADCQQVLSRVFTKLGLGSTTIRLPSTTGFSFWVFPGETLDRLACYFTVPGTSGQRIDIINHLKTGSALSPTNAIQVASTRALILSDPANAGMAAAMNPVGTFTSWYRAWIPDTTLDVVEVYMRSVLEPHGLTLHFIDDFHAYHARYGEVHCGTNAKRAPLELTRPERWWQFYDPDYDVSYSP